MTDTTTRPAFKVSEAKREQFEDVLGEMFVEAIRRGSIGLDNCVKRLLRVIEEPEEPEFTWADVREGDVVEWVFLSDGSLGHFIANNRTYANWVGNLLRVDRKDASGRYVTVFERSES